MRNDATKRWIQFYVNVIADVDVVGLFVSFHSPKTDIRQRHFSRHFDDIDLFDKTIKERVARRQREKEEEEEEGKWIYDVCVHCS